MSAVGLVGREPVLAAARAALDDALAGSGQLLLVSGEPGIGKTAVLAELARDAGRRGARVLRGPCWDGAGTPSYWPWMQVLRAAGTELADLAPTERGRAGGAEAADARFRLFDAVVRHLAELAERTPLVVVLDDLQWADEPSLRLLEFVVRQLGARPVLLLGAFRDADVDAPLHGVAAAGQLLPLTGLGRTDVVALMTAVAGARPSDRTADDVWRRTGGNPFFVREVTRLLVAQGRSAHQLPDTVRDTLERRLARLSQPCAELLAAAAVLGVEVRPEVLARVVPAESSVELLDEAVRARVVVPVESPGRYRFTHDLFRETLAAGLAPASRAGLHVAAGRALAALQAAGAEVHEAEIAAHFVAAGIDEVAPEAVQHSAAAAADAGARLGFEEARLHFDRALAALDRVRTPEPGLRQELLLGRADVRNRAGDARGARADYHRVVDLARRAGDPTALARAALGLHAVGARELPAHAAIAALLTEAATALPAVPSATRARVLTALVRGRWYFGDEPDRAGIEGAAREAVRVARAAGDPSALAAALLAMHDALWWPGTARRRLAVLDEMRGVARAADEPDLLAQAHQLRAAALLELGDPAGKAELARYVQAAAGLGHARGRWEARTRQATLAAIGGRALEADRLAVQALELGRAIGEPDALGVHGTLRGALVLFGDVPGESPVPPDELAESAPIPTLMPVLRAAALVAAGDGEAARRVLLGLTVDEIGDWYDLEWLAITAAVLARAGSDRQRLDAYQRIRPYAGLHAVVGGCASYWGAVDHHLGSLAASLGRREEAVAHLDAALAGYRRLGAPGWAQRCGEELERVRGVEEENVLRLEGGVWTLRYAGRQALLPDAKGVRDLATLLSAGRPVHALQLLGRPAPAATAAPVLDDRARAAYRARLAELEAEVDEAGSWQDTHRAEKLRAERDALVAELAAAAGLGGRPRRLGDEAERARKTVTARIRDALARIERVHPELAAHLRAAVHTGTSCSYTPAHHVRWRQ